MKTQKYQPYLFALALSTFCTYVIATGLPVTFNIEYLPIIWISSSLLFIASLLYEFYTNFGKK